MTRKTVMRKIYLIFLNCHLTDRGSDWMCCGDVFVDYKCKLTEGGIISYESKDSNLWTETLNSLSYRLQTADLALNRKVFYCETSLVNFTRDFWTILTNSLI